MDSYSSKKIHNTKHYLDQIKGINYDKRLSNKMVF
jgi:hypothetical protein